MNGKDKKISVEMLQAIQANIAVLLFQTLNYHWNIVGPEFHDYHILFDKQYKQLFEDMDLVAERIRALEGCALGSMQAMIKGAQIKEDEGKVPAPKQMVTHLLQQYEYHIEQIREGISYMEDKDLDDHGTRKMLEDLIAEHEKTAWMLRSLLGR